MTRIVGAIVVLTLTASLAACGEPGTDEDFREWYQRTHAPPARR